MNAERLALDAWVDTLLDAQTCPGEQRAAAWAWYHRWMALLSLDHLEDGGQPDSRSDHSHLGDGLAVSPLDAARCLWEYRRTQAFLRGLKAALDQAIARFPGQRIEVLEAGCGPLAPLSLAFAGRYPPHLVCFNLLDIHPSSLDCARTIARALDVEASIRLLPPADATRVQLDLSPHIIVCELLQQGLSKEPQVAATLNLAPQLRDGGFFLPRRVDVHSVRYGAPAVDKPPPIIDLGRVFRFDALTLSGDDPLAGELFTAPPGMDADDHYLLARVDVHDGHRLLDNESSINLPLKTRGPAKGDRVRARYRLGAAPAVVFEPA